MNFLNEHQLKLHVTILGWLYIVGNAIFLLIGAFVFMLLAGIGVASGDSQAMAILSIVGTVVGALLAVIAIPGLVAGYGLLARKAWGRVLAIVVGILGLINFPVGTAIGIYAILVLLQEEANGYFMSPTSNEREP
jgi:hypothetical protein